MKYSFIFLAFILINVTTLLSQELYKQPLSQIPVGLIKGEVIKYPLDSYFQCDFELDSNEQIYLANPYERTIQNINSEGKQIKIIKVPDEYMMGFEILMMEISLDSSDNIFCLLTNNGRFINLLYIQKDFQDILEVKLNQNMDGEIRKFYVNSDGNLYFNTFPWVLDYTGESLGNNYVFEKDGTFICRTDYFITTSNLKKIKFLYSDEYTTISQFEQNEQSIIDCKRSTKLNELTSVNEYEPTRNISRESWWYIGSDNQSNIYVANSSKILKINSILNLEEEYQYKDISNNNHLITNYRALRVSPKGRIYSLNSSPRKENNDSRYSANEVNIHIIRIK